MNAVNAGIACVAGGMLLYSSLVNIMAEDVKRPVSLTPSSPPSPFPLAIPLLIAQDMAKGMLRREGRHAHALVSFDRSVCVACTQMVLASRRLRSGMCAAFFVGAASMSALAAGELAVGGDDGHAHR